MKNNVAYPFVKWGLFFSIQVFSVDHFMIFPYYVIKNAQLLEHQEPSKIIETSQ